jgi:rSAM/selenodomain-associated transferase 1
MNRVVVLLARAPSAQGKTRLTAHLPEGRAQALRARLFLDTLAAVRAAGYPVVVSFTPDTAREEVRELVGEGALIPQSGDDLGTRMRNAMIEVFATGAGAVVLIGSDLPTLPPENIVHAFDLLEGAGFSPAVPGCDVVLGPSEDGGFYLVGARGHMPDIFSAVDWGQSDVLERVSAAAHYAGVTIARAPEWWDVDAPQDLRRCPGYDEFA